MLCLFLMRLYIGMCVLFMSIFKSFMSLCPNHNYTFKLKKVKKTQNFKATNLKF